MSVDLEFTSKGTEKVVGDQQKMADGAKALALLYKEQNRELKQMGKDSERIYQSTRTEIEKLEQQANKLRAAVVNAQLSDADRQKASAALARVEEKLQSITTESGKAGGALTEAFGGAKQQLLGSFATVAGAAAASVALVIKTVTDEMRSAQQMADKAAAMQLTIGASRNALLRNMVSNTPEERRAALAATAQIAADTGASEVAINLGLAGASAAAGGDFDAALDATRIAAQFLADSPSEIPEFAASLLDIAKVTGSNDARANLGMVATIGEEARIPNQKELSSATALAMLGAREFGLSAQESAPLFQTLTTTMGDTTGRMSATATIQLAKQLSEFEPEQIAGMSTAEKIRALQADRELAEQFLGSASFETKATGQIRGLLTDAESPTARGFARAMENFAKLDTQGLIERGEASLSVFEANELEPTARVRRGLDSARERQQALAATEFLTTEQRTQIADGFVDALGMSRTRANLAVRTAAGWDNRLSYEEAQELIDRETEWAHRAIESGFAPEDEQLTILRGLLELFREARDEIKRNTEETKKGKGIPAGTA